MLISSIPQYIQGITNAKLDLTGTSATVLFTVPSDADFNAAIVNSILVAEKSGNADTITVTVTSGTDVFTLFNVKAVGANTTVELLTKDLVLQSGEILKVQAATGNRLHVIASIQDLSKTRITTSAITRI
mgnify:FL=1|tara:strand:+ start:339 stop:728 length:390 start_codon:yes stop_codon:yes gene_type:complete